MGMEQPVNTIILDSIADGVFTVDMDFRITYINRAAEQILGIGGDEAIGKYCYEIFHANICEHSCALGETVETGRTITNKTIYIVNSGGERVPVSISTALLKDASGSIIGGVETFRDISDVEELRRAIEERYTSDDIVSKNKNLRDILELLPDIAESESSVLIDGPSGTGKELVARAIHNLSARKDMPIVAINCAALPENLLESELFGYRAGAFTDAKKDKPGKIAAAEGGTLFLDEIGEIPQLLQAKLLRFLQDKEYEPLGGVKTIQANVRIVSATNKDLLNEVRDGRFRSDLYYRLNVINISLPPLADRREDIPLLIKHFLRKYNAIKGRNIESVSDEVMNILMEYDYPGNIRELENAIEHAFALCKESYIQRRHLPARFKMDDRLVPAYSTLDELEHHYILLALERNQFNRTRAAQELGINPSTLWRKIKKYKML
jgi:PAS domain S-box-containing protein